MRQTRRAELLLDVTRQFASVAEQEPRHQGALRRRKVAAPGENPRTKRVGRAVQGRLGGLECEQLDGVEARNRVSPPESLVIAGERLEPARCHQRVARLEEPQLAGG